MNQAPAIHTVTTADDAWYRENTTLAQHTGWLQPVVSLYTSASFGPLALLALYAWWHTRRRADRSAMVAVAWLAVGTGISAAAGLALKQLFAENRPCQVIHLATMQPCPARATTPSPPTTPPSPWRWPQDSGSQDASSA